MKWAQQTRQMRNKSDNKRLRLGYTDEQALNTARYSTRWRA